MGLDGVRRPLVGGADEGAVPLHGKVQRQNGLARQGQGLPHNVQGQGLAASGLGRGNDGTALEQAHRLYCQQFRVAGAYSHPVERAFFYIRHVMISFALSVRPSRPYTLENTTAPV